MKEFFLFIGKEEKERIRKKKKENERKERIGNKCVIYV